MSDLDKRLNQFSKFGQATRQIQVYVEGTAFIPPSQAEIKQSFELQGWNVVDVSVISAVSAYFRAAKVTITLNTSTTDADILVKVRSIMKEFLTVSQVSIVKGKLTPDEILGNDDFLNNLGLGLGITTGTAVILGLVGFGLYIKILSGK